MVAFSYRPVQTLNATHLVKTMARDDPYYTEISDIVMSTTPLVTPSEQSPTHNSPEISSKVRKRNNRSRAISRIDTFLSSHLDEQDLIRNVTKGHTLLGLASFEYAPKPVNHFLFRMSLILSKI